MKKMLKKPMFTFILGAIIFGSIGVYAAVNYSASQITYNKHGKATVEEALNDLYGKQPKIICNYQSNGSYGQKGHVGALYDCEVGTNIHKNFYILTIENKFVNLIMDTNLNNNTYSWSDAYNYFINNSTGIALKNQWNNVFNVSLPSAQEIANAVGNSSWKVQDNNAWWCLETKTKDTYDNCVNNTKTTAWLWNNLQNCSNYNCDNSADSTWPLGYWTQDSLKGSGNYGWTIERQGRLNNGPSDSNSSSGIRPVITILKSQLSN